MQNAKTNTNNLKTNKKQINNIKKINKNLGDIKGSRYIVLLFYKIAAVQSKRRKKRKKPHSGEVDNKSYPKRKLQRIEIDNGSVTDNEFESEPSDQSELFAGEKSDQVVKRKGVGYRSRLSHFFGILGILNEISLIKI